MPLLRGYQLEADDKSADRLGMCGLPSRPTEEFMSKEKFYQEIDKQVDKLRDQLEYLWENEDKVAGGPFKNYTFYDSLSRRIYMIDLAVYAPDRDKLPFVKRMEIIAKTFRTIFDPEDDDE